MFQSTKLQKRRVVDVYEDADSWTTGEGVCWTVGQKGLYNLPRISYFDERPFHSLQLYGILEQELDIKAHVEDCFKY